MNRRVLILAFCCLVSSAISPLWAQTDSIEERISSDIGLFPKKDPGGLKTLQVSGYYRFFATYTTQQLPYFLNQAAGDTVLPKSLFIGDDSQLPNLLVNVSARVSDRATFGFDIYMFQFLNGNIKPAYGVQVPDSLRPNTQQPLPLPLVRLGSSLSLNLGLNLHGAFKTNFGNLNVHVGGTQWFAMSDLTMASFKGYNRYILFERNPWDPVGTSISGRYDQYFEEGAIDQDERWGNRAFFGLIVDGNSLPKGYSFAVLTGKTELNGGFSPTPNYTYGGMVRKDFGANNFVAVNTINSHSFTDSLALTTYGFNMATVEFGVMHKGFVLNGEVGAADYFSPVNDDGWGEALQLKFRTPEKFKLPVFELHYFRISPKVVNNNAVFWNTATPEYSVNNIPAGSIGSSAVLQPFGSSIVRLGQMTNNRTGLNLNIQTGKKKLSFSGGLGSSSEIIPAAAVITYGHPVNQYTRSRFWRWEFPADIGPYQRYSDIFRDMYETVNLSDDSSGIVVNKKYFNVMEGQFKYRTKVSGHELFVFALFQMNSVQRKWSPVIVTNENAYIRQYASEFEAYYRLSRLLMLSAYYGYERTIGNYLTDIDEVSRRPRNQYGHGIGGGLDVALGKNTRLYLRQRFFYFQDESFDLDYFKGREFTVELKSFF
jgi:hypothetical protein